MKMRAISAVWKKQVKDTLKNKEVLIQFFLFPLMAIIMQNAIKVPGMPENFFVVMFATMYVGMAPLTAMAAILAEEKEKNTLRVLLMSNVKAAEYLAGTGIYVLAVCMLGALVFGVVGNYQGRELALFLLVMGIGILSSLMIGAAIGVLSRSQMGATSMTVPVMLVFSFLPMISMFNSGVARVSRFTYSQQISNLMGEIGTKVMNVESIVIIAVNMLLASGVFWVTYKRCGLE